MQTAKWPYFLLALYQVLLNRRIHYVLTAKVKGESLPYVLLWPHLLVAVLIGTAWGAGMILGRHLHPLLHVSAFTIVLGSLALIAIEHMRFPEPYDPSLGLSSRRIKKNVETRKRRHAKVRFQS